MYGDACSNCTFAPRKRANITEVYKALNPFSQANFRGSFGNFILLSMYSARFLHSVCLPPIEGSCVDRSADKLWLSRLDEMDAAFNESVAVITDIADMLGDWVNLLNTTQLFEQFGEGDSNEVAAMKVMTYLDQNLPDFYIQVFVADLGNDIERSTNIFRRGCSKSTPPCSTNRETTGHFWFDDIRGKSLSIRYRLKSLPPSPSMISINGISRAFPDFYNEAASRLNRTVQLALGRPDGFGFMCPFDIGGGFGGQDDFFLRSVPACFVDLCFVCNDAESAAFNSVLTQSFYIFRLGANNVQVATNNATAFNTFNPRIGRRFFAEDEFDDFTFYYN